VNLVVKYTILQIFCFDKCEELAKFHQVLMTK